MYRPHEETPDFGTPSISDTTITPNQNMRISLIRPARMLWSILYHRPYDRHRTQSIHHNLGRYRTPCCTTATNMTANDTTDILLYGPGAIGTFYAFILSRNPTVRLSVCARSNHSAVLTNGITFHSKRHGSHTFHPHKVLHDPAEAHQTYDYIVCCNKAVHTDAVVEALKPAVDESRTTIAIMQNGVGNEIPFREAFPGVTIISGVVWVGATQHTPGVVTHHSHEDTELGLFPNPKMSKEVEEGRLNAFHRLLTDGGTDATIQTAIQTARWKKTIWNMAWNGLTTLTGCDVEYWLGSSELSTPLTRRLMGEAIAVARAVGVEGIEEGLAEELIERVRPMGRLFSSMYHDSRAGRPMEVDVIFGHAVREGRRLGLQIPTLECLYALLLAVDGRMAREKEESRG